MSKKTKILRLKVVNAEQHEGLSLRCLKKNNHICGIHGQLVKAGFKEGDKLLLVKEDECDVLRKRRSIKPSKQIKQKLNEGEWKRSSGLGLCPKCKEELFDHNRIEGYEGCVIDCNGGIHKL